MLRFKRHIAFLLLIFTVVYSVDLHGLSHVLEDAHEDDSNHCELCIINHQKDQNHFALEPCQDSFELPILVSLFTGFQEIHTEQASFKPHFLNGQLFNRPPPLYI
jgi:hypothetical protein